MRRRHCLGLAALGLLLHPALAPLARATPSDEEHRLISALIERVQHMSTMKFLRNGEVHNAREAAEHMQAKYKHFREQIVTAEDFIDRCASRSEGTGRPYRIQLADGTAREAQDFLLQELRALRQQRPSGQKGASPSMVVR